ncbi:MAG: DUF1643 domain-containing protein [Cytophagaceae bacterium]|nr:DUF1643 domain-containing protein [Cytophagaceae bacterium]
MIIPTDYQPYCFILGRKGGNPLVAVCMNPSAARVEYSDMTINTAISAAEKLGYDGWIVIKNQRKSSSNNVIYVLTIIFLPIKFIV